jgi:hypothetical protein
MRAWNKIGIIFVARLEQNRDNRYFRGMNSLNHETKKQLGCEIPTLFTLSIRTRIFDFLLS